MADRKLLPDRRGCETIKFEFESLKWFATIGRFSDGDIGEIFLSSAKTGTLLQAMSKDAAVCASIALQYGAPVDVIRKALTRGSDSAAGSPLGKAFDIIQGKVDG